MSNAALRCTRPPPPRAPRRPLPEGACDSHAHVFGPSDRYPYATGTQYRPADRAYFPPDVTVDDYVALLAALGVRHAVLVQPNIYGSDHRCLLNALARFNGGARGIGVVSMTASDEELRALHQAGLRGVRFHGVGAHHMDALRDFSARLSAMTWHIQIYASLDWIAAHAAPLATLACPVVFDHFAGLQLDAPGVERDFQTLLRLVAEGPVWVKLSAPFRVMPRSPPYHALAGRARACRCRAASPALGQRLALSARCRAIARRRRSAGRSGGMAPAFGSSARGTLRQSPDAIRTGR